MFKKGDKVKRIKCTVNGCYIDNIYTIKDIFKKTLTNGYQVTLDEVQGQFDSSFFESVEDVGVQLTSGMRVVYGCGEVGIVIEDIDVVAFKDGYDNLHLINSPTDKDWLVEKVYQGFTKSSYILNFNELGVLLWERKSKKQLEIDKLKAQIQDLQTQLIKLTS